jgi:hypothetical protein
LLAKNEKIFGGENLTEKSVEKWVETKIDGLKIGMVLAR